MLIFFYFHCIVLLKIKFGLIKKEGIWIFTMKQYIYIYIYIYIHKAYWKQYNQITRLFLRR
jgi:hypothetical protein